MNRKGQTFLDEFKQLWVVIAVLLVGLIVVGALASMLLAVLIPGAIIALALVLISRIVRKRAGDGEKPAD
ncbi:MAG TPA: hypothetical protein VMY39_08490 [Planctomycetota bacterium]|nr:hypothetical protein [Planctomycetota bacterium]HUV39641.1 hypothetical protein [Planctomycetota bacterium]